MKSIKQQYIDLQEGKMSQSNFMRNVRMTLPQFITNVTSYNDTVRILKNKGIITEAEVSKPEDDTIKDDEVEDILKHLEDEEDAKHTAPNIGALREAKTKWENLSGKVMYDQFKEIDNLNGQEVFTGITCEMENNPLLSKKEATKIVVKNLIKQPYYYTDYKLSGVEGYEPGIIGNVDPKTREMKPVAKDNLVDKAMGMKPVKNVAKAKASANKAKKETNKAKDVDVLSLVAQTLRGVPKMQSQGEKAKIVKLRETTQKIADEIMSEKLTFTDYDKWLEALYDTHPFIKGNEDKYFTKSKHFVNVSRGLQSFGYWYDGKAADPEAKGTVTPPYDVSSLVYPQGSRKD